MKIKKKKKKLVRLQEILFAPHVEDGEKIIFVVHRHPVMLFKKLFEMILVSLLLPTFLWYLFPEIFYVFAIWILISIWRIAYEIFVWFHDAILITSVSLIDVKWNGPFDRTSSRLDYTQIEGTSYEIKGFWRTILNFGLLKIDGAGTSIQLPDAISPTDAEKVILAEQGKIATDKSLKDAQVLKDLLANMIAAHNKNVNLGEILE